MIKKLLKIKCDDGLDARPIALLVQEASQYESRVFIEIGSKKINAKSIMGMMSLKLSGGEDLTVVAEGVDEEAAANGIEKFLEHAR